VAIGVLPSLTNVMGWTDIANSTSLSQLLTSPIYGTTYHISIKAINEAGLEALFVSNGQILLDPSAGIEDLLQNVVVFPNPFYEEVIVKGFLGFSDICVLDIQGKIVYSEKNYAGQAIDLSKLANGTYQFIIRQGDQMRIEKLIKQ